MKRKRLLVGLCLGTLVGGIVYLLLNREPDRPPQRMEKQDSAILEQPAAPIEPIEISPASTLSRFSGKWTTVRHN